jgi:hypothetical protein
MRSAEAPQLARVTRCLTGPDLFELGRSRGRGDCRRGDRRHFAPGRAPQLASVVLCSPTPSSRMDRTRTGLTAAAVDHRPCIRPKLRSSWSVAHRSGWCAGVLASRC